MSLLLAVLGAASADGAWCALVGMPPISAEAARDFGIELSRLPLVPCPGSSWVEVVGALLDAVDVVVARAPARLADGDIRRLAARTRAKGAVFVPFLAGAAGLGAAQWPHADVRLSVERRELVGHRAGLRPVAAAPGHRDGRGAWARRLAVDPPGSGCRPRAGGVEPFVIQPLATVVPLEPALVGRARSHLGGAMASRHPRMATLWCPDWPVTAARMTSGAPGDAAVAVVTANHVIACSSVARGAGVRRGMRRREAQSRCPDLVVLARDEIAEARCFEPVIVAVESLVPAVEVMRPGLAAVGVRGPARHFAGEPAFVDALWQAVGWLTEDACQIGVADGAFAAEQAARRAMIVPAGESAEFLADFPVTTLSAFGNTDLVDLLQRLGIHTLGAFAALPAS